MATSPTQRTLAYLRKRGEVPGVVEKWNPHARLRQDFLGFADIVSARPACGEIVAVQCTSGSNVAARIHKIRDSANARFWLESGGRIEVWGWRKTGPKDGRKLWKPRVVAIRLCEGGVDTEELEDSAQAA